MTDFPLALLFALLLVFSLAALSPHPLKAQEDPAATLQSRTYDGVQVPHGFLAAATTYGVLFFHARDEVPASENSPFGTFEAPRAAVRLPDSVNALLWHRGNLFAANGPHGIKVLQAPAADGTGAGLRSEWETGGAAMGLAGAGEWLVVAEGVMGISVWRIDDPEAPSKLALVDTAGYARDVEAQLVDGRIRVWVANGRAGVLRLDLDVHTGETLATTRLATPGDCRGVATGPDDVLYLGVGTNACRTNRALAEKALQCVAVRDKARGIVPFGRGLLVADGGAGLALYAWDEQGKGAEVARLAPAAGSMNRVAVIDGRPVAAADYSGLVLLPETFGDPAETEEK